MRPNRSPAARTAVSASARLVTSSFTGSRLSDGTSAAAMRSVSRPVATTACPATSTARAISAPRPRPWKGDLEWGRIVGYEYFALTHPSIDLWGVEDMVKKETYENYRRSSSPHETTE
jgi:hypothetical protein